MKFEEYYHYLLTLDYLKMLMFMTTPFFPKRFRDGWTPQPITIG